MITITETAAEIILETIDAQEMENVYLELRITGGGCSGLQYAFNNLMAFGLNDKFFQFILLMSIQSNKFLS